MVGYPFPIGSQSADPPNIVEPSFNKDNQNTDPKNYLQECKNATVDKKGECKPKKNKETMEQSLLTLTKSFIDNDPTEKLQKFMAGENKKSRKYKMEMMKMMFGQLHLPFQELSSSILFHYHSPSSGGNSSRFQQIPFHKNRVTTEGKRNPIKKITTSKQSIFYQFFSILINWKTTRKTSD